MQSGRLQPNQTEGIDDTYEEYPAPSGYPVYPAYANPYAQTNVDQPKGGASKVITTIALIVAIIACLVLIFSFASCSTAFTHALSDITGDEAPGVSDSVPKIGVISIASSIDYNSTSSSPQGLRALLSQASSRDDIKAVVLRIDSGGGVATAGEEMSKYVQEFDKPIVVSCAATTASAAYEIASQADYIYAAKTSSVGSIGVAMEVTDLSGLYEKLGISIDAIKSSNSKDSTYGNRPLTEEEREWYQGMVDQIDADFITTVAAGRDMSVEDVEKLANGMSYTGIDAVECSLVDEIGYLEDAIAMASVLAGYDQPLVEASLTLGTKNGISTLLDYLGSEERDMPTSSSSILMQNASSAMKGDE